MSSHGHKTLNRMREGLIHGRGSLSKHLRRLAEDTKLAPGDKDSILCELLLMVTTSGGFRKESNWELALSSCCGELLNTRCDIVPAEVKPEGDMRVLSVWLDRIERFLGEDEDAFVDEMSVFESCIMFLSRLDEEATMVLLTRIRSWLEDGPLLRQAGASALLYGLFCSSHSLTWSERSTEWCVQCLPLIFEHSDENGRLFYSACELSYQLPSSPELVATLEGLLAHAREPWKRIELEDALRVARPAEPVDDRPAPIQAGNRRGRLIRPHRT